MSVVVNVKKSVVTLEDIELALALKIREYDLVNYNKFIVVISSYDRLAEKYFGFRIKNRKKPIEIHDPTYTKSDRSFYIFTDFIMKYKNEENRIERYNDFYHFFMDLPVWNGKFRIDFIPIKDEKELSEWQD